MNVPAVNEVNESQIGVVRVGHAPCVILVKPGDVFWAVCNMGMSQRTIGSGKTTLMHRLVHHVQNWRGKRGYVLNLDPAVASVPFPCNIDIRDTVNYKNVMQEYHLGPNGGILTSLNLFATKFDEVNIACHLKRPSCCYFYLENAGRALVIFLLDDGGNPSADITSPLAATLTSLYIRSWDWLRRKQDHWTTSLSILRDR